MASKYLYNRYLSMWRKIDECEEAPSTAISASPRLFINESVKSWRDKTTAEDLMAALSEVLSSFTPHDRELVLEYAECGSYAEVGRRIGHARQGVKAYIDKLLDTIRVRVESSI